jgi:hypothetical protein
MKTEPGIYMDKIKRFKDFEKIWEFTEFNLQRMNPDRGGMMPNVDDPQLSVNAYDKHQNAILAASDKLKNILSALYNTSAFSQLKSRIFLESQNINSMRIQRIIKSSDIKYDFYIHFTLSDKEYFGVVKDMLGVQPKVLSEVFKDTELVLTREWITKTKGQIIKILKKWLQIEPGEYKCLNEGVNCINMKTGNLTRLEKDTVIEVKTCYDDKIVITHENEFYTLQNDEFVYFNYWFSKMNKEYNISEIPD